MSIQFSGISSGLPVDQIVTQLLNLEHRPIDLLNERKDKITAQQAQYTAVSTRVSSLRDALSKLTDANLGTSLDLFQGKLASSSNAAVATASVTNTAAAGSFTLEVLGLATATKATSLSAIGNYTAGTSALSTVAEGAIKSGNFTVFINNQARTIAVDATTDTVQDVLDLVATEISTVTGQAATGTVDATGKLQLNYAAGTNVQFGATGDTSNFAKITYLTTGDANTPTLDTFTAQYGTSTIDREGTLIGNAVGLQNNTIAAGTFTIGGATFTIDNTTTLAGLLGDINSSSKANAFVSFNPTTNKFEAVSKVTGEQAITFNDNGTGFLQSLGLVNGADTLSSQTLGNNAQIKINGGSVLESTSNTVDESVTSLTGVTLNLLAPAVGSPITVSVSQNTDQLKTAVNDVITKFNAAISFIDSQTGKDGVLRGESSIISLRNRLFSQFTDRIGSLTTYNSVSQVGISSGSVNTSPQGAISKTFSLNEAKFLAALADNPDEVKKLFIGDGVTDGILNKLETLVEGAMDPEFGVFSSRSASANSQIKAINDAIARTEDRLETKEKQLRAQFAAMEQLISQFQSQQGAINNIGR
jgi:flagellar hook-associated protein 2